MTMLTPDEDSIERLARMVGALGVAVDEDDFTISDEEWRSLPKHLTRKVEKYEQEIRDERKGQ